MDTGAESYDRFLHGDESGLVEIVKTYSDGLILFLRPIAGDLQTAEDLAQETFAKLCLKKPKYRSESSFKTWLYAIGRNLALDQRRKRMRRVTVPLQDAALLPDEERALWELADAGRNREAVRLAMRSLSPVHAQVLTLLYFEDMKVKDVARIMRRSPHAVENLSSRAKQALKKELEKKGFRYEIV